MLIALIFLFNFLCYLHGPFGTSEDGNKTFNDHENEEGKSKEMLYAKNHQAWLVLLVKLKLGTLNLKLNIFRRLLKG